MVVLTVSTLLDVSGGAYVNVSSGATRVTLLVLFRCTTIPQVLIVDVVVVVVYSFVRLRARLFFCLFV